jgi:hypothetical protein
MSTPEKEAVEAPRKKDALDFLTGKVGKIAALILALTLVVTNLETLVSKVQVFAKKHFSEEVVPVPPAPLPQSCVEIYKVDYPEEIAYSEWDDHFIRVTGRNNCKKDLGLYLTFTHRVGTEPPRVVLRSPFADTHPDCTGASALSLPKCWDQNNNIKVVEGRGQWDAPLPPASRLGSFETERLMFRLEVYDLDAPNSEAVWKNTVAITIRDDAGLQ